MATFNYNQVAQLAKNAIDQFGQDVTLTKTIVGEYDPVIGEAAVTKTSQSARGVVFDYGTKNIDGTLIKQGDRQLYMSPIGLVAVADNYTVTVTGVTYTITMVKVLNPGGVNLLYECNIRP